MKIVIEEDERYPDFSASVLKDGELYGVNAALVSVSAAQYRKMVAVQEAYGKLQNQLRKLSDNSSAHPPI